MTENVGHTHNKLSVAKTVCIVEWLGRFIQLSVILAQCCTWQRTVENVNEVIWKNAPFCFFNKPIFFAQNCAGLGRVHTVEQSTAFSSMSSGLDYKGVHVKSYLSSKATDTPCSLESETCPRKPQWKKWVWVLKNSGTSIHSWRCESQEKGQACLATWFKFWEIKGAQCLWCPGSEWNTTQREFESGG